MDRILTPLERKVTGLSFFGERGSGKTLGMTTLGYIAYLDGKKIYSNYNLGFPHIKITDTNFHNDIQADGKEKVILLDDMLSGSGSNKNTVHQSELNRILTLGRKLIAQDEKTIIAFSSPLLDQYSNTIKQFTDYYIECKTWSWSDNPKPCLIHLKWYDRDPSKMRFIKPKIITKFNLEKLNVADLFNTKEAPKPITSGVYREIWAELSEYAYCSKRGIIAYLTEKIADKWALSHNRAKHYARSIIAGYNPNTEQEEKPPTKTEWGGLRTDL